MAPTRNHDYKEYTYSSIPSSSSSAVYDSTTPGKHSSGSKRFHGSSNSGYERFRIIEMTEKGSTLLQYVAAAAANMCTVAGGVMLGWTSPVLSKLSDEKNTDNPFGRTLAADEKAWIGSLVAVGAMSGCFFAGDLVERFGRKRTLLSSIVPFEIGWVLIATATKVEQLYAARIILGFALAFPFTVVPMYCGEIAETSVRGALGSFLQLFITIGMLFSYAVGPYVSYLVFWILCAIFPVIFFACFFTMPESPYYLLKIGQREEAVSALARLRSKTPASVQKEADEMQQAVEEAFRNEASILDLFKEKANLKALIFTCLLAIFQQLSGVNVVLFFMEDIFKAAKLESIPTSVATIIVGVVQMLASGVTPIVVDRLGRKMLLIFSGIGEIFTLCALGIYFYLKDVSLTDVSAISMLPVISLVIFISTYSVGWGPLPWTVLGELFASNVKSKASGITVWVCWFFGFLITRFSSNLSEAFGNCTLYWMFAVCSLVSVLFTIFVLPETKGKTLRQIQDELNGVRSSIPEFDGTIKK